ncbi:hypothetical protein [Prevotella jejuni]|uniref:hypothetical protein n=1 Tax=Prevotella jejuni TaxID=1177574 RepID=UPI001C5D8D08|nr:hypothetical protein [Prevotella jejuni]MBW4772268.1 hypothetical protein [Prevotella jejuni]
MIKSVTPPSIVHSVTLSIIFWLKVFTLSLLYPVSEDLRNYSHSKVIQSKSNLLSLLSFGVDI